ncbi:MAG: hypothetical protein EOP06_26255, partial [Proteobacteria bacterium]
MDRDDVILHANTSSTKKRFYGMAIGNVVMNLPVVATRLLYLAKKLAHSQARKVRQSLALFLTDIVSASLAFGIAFVTRYGFETVQVRPELSKALLMGGGQYLLVCAFVFPLAGLYSRN